MQPVKLVLFYVFSCWLFVIIAACHISSDSDLSIYSLGRIVHAAEERAMKKMGRYVSLPELERFEGERFLAYRQHVEKSHHARVIMYVSAGRYCLEIIKGAKVISMNQSGEFASRSKRDEMNDLTDNRDGHCSK